MGIPEISFSVGSTLFLSSHPFIVLTCGECSSTRGGVGQLFIMNR
jgi:hypothetical protein